MDSALERTLWFNLRPRNPKEKGRGYLIYGGSENPETKKQVSGINPLEERGVTEISAIAHRITGMWFLQ